MKRVSPTGARGCEAADGRSDRRNGAFRAPAGAANPPAAPPAAISALRVAVGRGALRDSADGRDLERHQRPVPSLAGLRRPPATAPRPTRSHRRRRLDPRAARLLPRPAHPFETDLVRAVRSGKTPYVRFDRNAYSIPHTHVRKPLTLVAGATRVRIFDGQTELARHRRSYDTGQTIEDPERLEGLLAATRQANAHTTRDRLRVAAPPPPRSSTASPNVASRCARTPPGSSPSSTTTGRRNSPPPSPTSSRPDVGSADSAAPPAHPARPARTA